MVAHPEEFVEAPNPFKDIDAFNDWFYNKFVPLLGNYEEREVNYATSTIGMQLDFLLLMHIEIQKICKVNQNFFILIIMGLSIQ